MNLFNANCNSYRYEIIVNYKGQRVVELSFFKTSADAKAKTDELNKHHGYPKLYS